MLFLIFILMKFNCNFICLLKINSYLYINVKQLKLLKMKTIKITNEEIYNERVADVELNLFGMTGDVSIELEGEGERCFTGEHGANDYKEEYGFVIVNE